jgi:hypothetical protein
VGGSEAVVAPILRGYDRQKGERDTHLKCLYFKLWAKA